MTKFKIVAQEEYSGIAQQILEYVKELGQETELILSTDDFDYANNIIETSKEIALLKREGLALISIDATGGLAFVIASKVKGMVSSQISDEHSSHMTKEHNGSVGLNLGADITALPLMKSIIKKFIEEEFAAGRHMVRIDMLDSMC